MALVFCRECRAHVSSEAPTCPRCGVPGPGTVPGPPSLRGLDRETHAWLFEQLSAGVPKAPLARHVASAYGIGGEDALRLVRSVETQALTVAEGGVPARRGSGRNIAASLLSLWIPGLGQVTQGRVGRGAAMFAGAALLWVVLLGWVVHIAAAVEAARWDAGQGT